MKVLTIINGGVSLVLEPENTMEEEVLKALTKQSNQIVEIRNSVTILSRIIKGSVLIAGKNTYQESSDTNLKKNETENL